MDLKQLLHTYLGQNRVMQLATQAERKLWACTVHYYSDDELNLYWVSDESREHSRYIAQNAQVAAAIVIHEDKPDEKYVIGLSIGGQAHVVEEPDQALCERYIEKLDKNPRLLEEIMDDNNPTRLYRLTPGRVVLFDSKDFPDNPRQELKIESKASL